MQTWDTSGGVAPNTASGLCAHRGPSGDENQKEGNKCLGTLTLQNLVGGGGDQLRELVWGRLHAPK